MALHSFCGILTLQVGVAIIAVVFWVIGILTFLVNFFEFFDRGDDQTSVPVFALTISTFVILIVLAGVIAFFSAYNESSSLCMAGVGLTCLITVMWVTLSSVSFYNDESFLQYICIHDRCPETFWLAPLKYRLATEDKSHYDYDTTTLINPNSSTTIPSLTTSSTERIKRNVDIGNLKFDFASYYIDVDDVPITNPGGKTGYIFGLPLVGAVILFICNFFLFLFTILVLWSYGQELEWTNNYLQDIPEYVPS